MARAIAEIREMFDDCSGRWSEQHDRMREDIKFSNPADPQQWPENVVRDRTQDGRPCLTFDRTNAFIAQVVNDGRQNKPSITVIPGDSSASIKTARAIEGMIRHIEYVSRAAIAYDTALDAAARPGLGWLLVKPEMVDPALNQQEIRISRVVDPLSVTLDPDSQDPDGSDALFGFVESSMSRKAFERKYPKAKAISWDGDTSNGWFGENSVRICEMQEVETKKSNRIVCSLQGQQITLTEDEYWQLAKAIGSKPEVVSTFTAEERVVRWYKVSGADILEESVFPSQYLGIIPVIGDEVWLDGKRYLSGMVRRMRSGQEAYNYERTSYIEQVALQPKAPYVGALEAFEGHEDKWARANRSNEPYLPFNHIDEMGNPIPAPSRQAPPPIAAAFIQGAQLASQDIEFGVGMFRANLGAATAEHSGKAILAKQHEGDTANYHYVDNLSRSIEQLGRVVVDMLPRLYDTAREVRILGEDGKSGIVRIDPNGTGPDTINLQSGKYDVRVKSGPSYSTLRQQTNDALGQIIQSAPQLMPVLGPTWAKLQDWPDADKIARLLLAMAPPQVQLVASEGEEGAEVPPQVTAQLQQMQQQVQQSGQMIEQLTQALHAAHDKLQAEEEDKGIENAKLLIDHYNAETNRLKVMGAALNPQEVATLAAQLVMQALHSPAQPEQMPSDGSPQHEALEPPDYEALEQSGAMPDADEHAQPAGLDVAGTFPGGNLA